MNKTYNSISINDLSATAIIFGEELSSDGPRLLAGPGREITPARDDTLRF